jgi:laminin B (domain IV)
MFRKSRLSYVALAIAIISMTPRASFASTFAQSTFDADRDGWLVKDLPWPNPGAPPVELQTFTPTQQPTGGNPGGRLTFSDPTANTWYWFAPAKFLGNKLGAYGGTLSFDLVVTGTGTPYDQEDVILVGGGLTLVFTLPAQPGTSFTSYHLGLTETGWRRDTRSGVPATQADMAAALSSLTAIYIRGEYRLSTDDAGQLDNVVLEGSGAICDIQLNQAIYHNGDQVTAQVWRLGNQDTSPLAVEFKVWFEVPGFAPISVLRFGADGSVSFPAGLNQNLGPATLFTVAPSTPRGTYAFSCRVVNPVTGAEFTHDLNPFEIQ